MKCNHCYPLCHCGAEASLHPEARRDPDHQNNCASQFKDACDCGFAESARRKRRGALLRDAARFPELEAMERELANYGEGK